MESPPVEAILKLAVEERLRIVQLIWDSIASEDVPLTAAECAEIDALVEEDDRAPDDVVSWAEARAQIRRSSC